MGLEPNRYLLGAKTNNPISPLPRPPSAVKNGDGIKAELLKSCQLQTLVVESSSALLISCPNSWTAKRIGEFLIGNLDRILHSLGIERTALNNGEGFIGYYEWDLIPIHLNNAINTLKVAIL